MQKAMKRFFLHGDVTEDGKSWFDAVADTFSPLPARPVIDARDEHWIALTQRTLSANNSGALFRPKDARNVFGYGPR